jgi:hypothetical protein
MSDVAWRTISSRLGWFVAATFVVSMLFFASHRFHILVPEPGFPPADETFVDGLIASFEHQQAHWPEDLVSSLSLAAGFVGLALLGVTLRRAMGSEHPRGAVLAVAFLVAGTIGAASQVLYLGATEVATNPMYCDCGFLAEEIVSREMAHQIALNVGFWMTDASVVLFAIGLWAFAALAPASDWVPDGLAMYARVLAVLAILSVIWDRVAAPLLDTGGTEIDFGLIGGVITLLVAGVLVPIWAVWVARAARFTAQEPETAAPAGD